MKLEKSKYFTIQELVAPEILAVLTEEAAWRLIPYAVICGLDNLRRAYGSPIWINGKGLTQCGIRAKNTTTGAPLSRHKLYDFETTAFDLHCDDLPHLTQIIEVNSMSYGITRMEDPDYTPTWRHVEYTTNIMVGALKIFKP
jgi:hypothetical protein